MDMKTEKTVYIARPHGVCGGVNQAIRIVEEALQTADSPVWVLHELVHNDFLTAELVRRGVRFTEDLMEVPDGSLLIFGAHGVSAEMERIAAAKHLRVTDATCPLVRKLQDAAREAVANGEKVLFFGHRGHPEVEGVMGRVPAGSLFLIENAAGVAELPELGDIPCRMLSQTTLNTREIGEVFGLLKERFPQAREGLGACYATTQRQEAVRKLSERVKNIFILGSERSSNSRRLQEIASENGAESILISGAADLPLEQLDGLAAVGISSGASAPELLFDGVLEKLSEFGFTQRVTVSGDEDEI